MVFLGRLAAAARVTSAVRAAPLVRFASSAPASRRNIDWENLGFSYTGTNAHVEYTWRDGAWDTGRLVSEPVVTLHIGSAVLHYGQALFEGLKAFECKDGKVRVFQPFNANSKRLNRGCERLQMPVVPEATFNTAVARALHANLDYVPPYRRGAMYIRPVIFGCGAKLGLGPAPEFKFIVFVSPVGDYYKGKALTGVDAVVADEYDRAAPLGTGAIKCGGNYAADLVPSSVAKGKGFPVVLYLDAKTRTCVEEFSTSNFVAISKDGSFVTPNSTSVLESVTNLVLQQVAKDHGLKVEKRPVLIDEVASCREVAACGTAVVLTPVNSITHNGRKMVVPGFQTLQQLRNSILDIQNGDAPDKHGWLQDI